MKLTPDQELEIALIKVNYNKVCDLFELTEDQRINPNCGQWIVNTIKQFQTSYTLARASKLVRSESQENTFPTPMPPQPAVLGQLSNTLMGVQNEGDKKV